MKIKGPVGELIDVGGAKQHKDVNPKYKWEILDVSGKAHKYTNIDLNNFDRFPINDNSVAGYYTSMTLEHVLPWKTRHVLSEMYRTLMPNSPIRIVVPDFEKGLNLFLKKPDALKTTGPYFPPDYPTTKLGLFLSWIVSPGPGKAYGRSGHQNAFDYETLHWWLATSKFRNITRKSYGNCHEYFVGKDSVHYKDWALYVEAIK